jgi:hypothetical protein
LPFKCDLQRYNMGAEALTRMDAAAAGAMLRSIDGASAGRLLASLDDGVVGTFLPSHVAVAVYTRSIMQLMTASMFV